MMFGVESSSRNLKSTTNNHPTENTSNSLLTEEASAPKLPLLAAQFERLQHAFGAIDARQTRLCQRLNRHAAAREDLAPQQRQALWQLDGSDMALLVGQSRLAGQHLQSLTMLLEQNPEVLSKPEVMSPDAYKQLMQPLMEAVAALPLIEVDATAAYSPDSDAAMNASLVDAISKAEHVNDQYGDMVSGLVDYFDKISGVRYYDYLKPSGDKYAPDMKGLASAMSKVNYDNAGIIICKGLTRSDFEKMAKQVFGADYGNWVSYTESPVGSGIGDVNISYYNPVYFALNGKGKVGSEAEIPGIIQGLGKEMNSSDMSMWDKSYSLQINRLSDMCNRAAQNLSRANSGYANLMKVLSGTISALAEVNKGMMKW